MGHQSMLSGFIFLLLPLIGFCCFDLLYEIDYRSLSVGTVATVLVLIALHIKSLKPCDTLSVKQILSQYSLLCFILIAPIYFYYLKRQMRSKSSVQQMQKNVLMNVIKLNKDSMFGKDHKFTEIKDVESFRKLVPVREYKDLEKYTELTNKGMPDILFKGEISYLVKTSGTTGKNKTFPYSNQTFKSLSIMATFIAMFYSTKKMITNAGRRITLQRSAVLRVFPKDRVNEHGIPVGPATKFFQTYSESYTTPDIAFKTIHSEPEMMYVQALFALWHENISYFEVFFPSVLIFFMHTVEKYWDQLLKDIEQGTVTIPNAQNVSEDVRKQLEQRIVPKPIRTQHLRSLFSKNRFNNFFTKAWPDASYMMLAKGASFKSSYEYLKKKYLGDFMTMSSLIGGSEGIQAINMSFVAQDVETYHPCIGLSFLEYIPLDATGADKGPPKLVHEIEEGIEYEVVITGKNGLYRIRVGDVVTVVGFDCSLPLIQITHRKAHCLTVHVEKIPESTILEALSAVSKKLGLSLVDFTATENVHFDDIKNSEDKEVSKHYVVFVEFDKEQVLDMKNAALFDKELMNLHENYALFRQDGFISPMQIIQVKHGSFIELKQFMLIKNIDTSAAQFKMPRILRDQNYLRKIYDMHYD